MYQNAETEIVENWVNDWEVFNIDITESALNIGTRGLMFDRREGREYPDRSIADLPNREEDSTAIQMFVSTWAADSFFQSGLSVHPVTMTVSSDRTGLIVDDVEDYAKGATAEYGSGTPIDIRFDLISVTDTQIEAASSTMGALVTFSF
jgi:hypothetical protein